jgi:hypothetical protein
MSWEVKKVFECECSIDGDVRIVSAPGEFERWCDAVRALMKHPERFSEEMASDDFYDIDGPPEPEDAAEYQDEEPTMTAEEKRQFLEEF